MLINFNLRKHDYFFFQILDPVRVVLLNFPKKNLRKQSLSNKIQKPSLQLQINIKTSLFSRTIFYFTNHNHASTKKLSFYYFTLSFIIIGLKILFPWLDYFFFFFFSSFFLNFFFSPFFFSSEIYKFKPVSHFTARTKKRATWIGSWNFTDMV